MEENKQAGTGAKPGAERADQSHGASLKPAAMRTISLEEHYASPAFMDGGAGNQLKQMAKSAEANPKATAGFQHFISQLTDIGEGRLAAMDAAGIDVQVLSLTSPGVEQLGAGDAIPMARDANNWVAEGIKKYPTRFAGFAALPTQAPDAAADELERVVKEYGFKGAMINGHSRGRYLDDPFFLPILERAEALAVPIYLHPTPPPQGVIEASYKGNYSPEIAVTLATGGWGWHIETATHLLRIILSGAFDKLPKLQFIVGHLGEAIPFMLPRFEIAFPKQVTKLERSISGYLRENVHYTFGGFNWTPAFLDLLMQVGTDRIMFSTDHPYSSMADARAFLDQIPVSPVDRARIAHGNAERLLRL
jgi:uncharacterized protein